MKIVQSSVNRGQALTVQHLNAYRTRCLGDLIKQRPPSIVVHGAACHITREVSETCSCTPAVLVFGARA